MIYNALISFIYSVAEYIVNLTPDMQSADFANVAIMQNMFAQARGMFNWINFFFPIDTLFVIIGLFLTIELISFASKAARWIASILTAGIVK